MTSNEKHYRFWQSDGLDNLVSLYRDFLRETDESPAETSFEDFCRYMFTQTQGEGKKGEYAFCYKAA